MVHRKRASVLRDFEIAAIIGHWRNGAEFDEIAKVTELVPALIVKNN
jgi:hypothetical protein